MASLLLKEIEDIGMSNKQDKSKSSHGSSISGYTFKSPKKASPAKKKKAVKKPSPKKAKKSSPKKAKTPKKVKNSPTLAQLRKECSEKKIKGCFKKDGVAVSKEDLIKLLKKNEESSVEKYEKKKKSPTKHLYSKKECTEMGEAIQTCIDDGLITKKSLSEIVGQTQKIKKEKKVKDENKPKRPTTAFFFFSKEKREEVKEALGTKKVTEVAARLGKIWKGMSSSQKEKFEILAAKDKKRYEREMKEYKQ